MNEDCEPMANGMNGRAEGGRFGAGNAFARGRGNPRASQAFELRRRLDAALTSEATQDRLEAVVRRLIELAEAGDVSATRLLLDRVSPPDSELRSRIEQLETILESDNAE